VRSVISIARTEGMLKVGDWHANRPLPLGVKQRWLFAMQMSALGRLYSSKRRIDCFFVSCRKNLSQRWRRPATANQSNKAEALRGGGLDRSELVDWQCDWSAACGVELPRVNSIR
jgi:hypothetical protein